MLEIHESALDKLQHAFELAEHRGLVPQLTKTLQYLATYACHDMPPDNTICRLFSDFAPFSFEFTMSLKKDDGAYRPWFNGGCIYQGPGLPADGSGPTFTVSLNKDEGWFVHT